MNKKQIALAVVLADFTAFTAYVLAQTGVVGFFELARANLASTQVLIDLVLALSMVLTWIWQDARRHDISPIPYVLLTLTLGSIGPLVYLIRRFGRDEVVAPHSVLPARAHAARA